jgi:uncharacterized DUF497 family protein
MICTDVHILSEMVEWDRDKAAANLEKHRIDFADAALALEDEMALTMPDNDESGKRFVTLGMDALGRVVVVVYTWEDEDIRIISARKANKRERSQYESKR